MSRKNPKPGQSSNKQSGTIKICPDKFTRWFELAGMNKTSFARKTGIARNTVPKFFKGESIRLGTAEDFLDAFGLDLESFLRGSDSDLSENPLRLTEPQRWKIDRLHGPAKSAPNGLSYRIATLRHRVISGKCSRGKLYDLMDLAKDRREEIRHYLRRHPEVCGKVDPHPNIPTNYDVIPLKNDTGWWVLDQWIEGKSLEDLCVEQSGTPIDEKSLRTLGENILAGLSALHEAGVIFRELAPDKVWIGTDWDRIQLTDFELAKFMEGAPSVSGRWESGYFRAPEVNDHEAHPQSDLYSFAKLVAWTLQGGNKTDDATSTVASLPSGVARSLKACLNVQKSGRPRDANEVLKRWKKWS